MYNQKTKKMKQFKLLAMAFAAMAVVSCSKNIDDDQKSEVQEGIPTRATITLTQSDAQTKISSSPTTEENAFKSAEIFIFDARGYLEARETFQTADITGKKKEVDITTGVKNIFVTANIPGDKIIATVGTTAYSAFSEQILTLTATPGDLTNATTGFYMSNTAPVTKSIVPNAASNAVTVTVGRIVAKVNLVFKTGAIVNGGGTIDQMGYKMFTLPKRNYLFPVMVGGVPVSPQYNVNDAPDTDFVKTAVIGTPAVLGWTDATNATNATYVTENIHLTPRNGNATYAMIRARFKPAFLVDPATNVSSPNTANVTFWVVKNSTGTAMSGYYSPKPSAAQVTTIGGASATLSEHTDGYGYYRLVVADNNKTIVGEKYRVLRNTFYGIVINTISGPGDGTEGETEPGLPIDPVEQNTKLNATITIANWSLVNQDANI